MEKPSNEVIEQASINMLENAVLRTEVIVPDICKNDKTPSWDGVLRLYRSHKTFSKSDLSGVIPIQVKGTRVNKLSTGKITFQADVSDLKNYQKGGGVIFFLIQSINFDEYKIFYASLLPFELRRLLDEAGSQETKRIKLQEFPCRYIDGMLRIFADFLSNREKQAKLLPNIKNFNDLKEAGFAFERLEFTVPSYKLTTPEDMFHEILTHPLYIYAKPKGIEALFAVDLIQPSSIINHLDVPVKANGELLYDHIDMIRQADGTRLLKFGTMITGKVMDDETITFKYDFCSSLQEQIRGLKFLLALIRGDIIEIGNLIPPSGKYHHDGCSVETLEKRFSWLLSVDAVLKKLHVKKDLEFRELTEQDLQNLQYLVIGIEQNIPVPFVLDGPVGSGILTIGNISILLFLSKAQGEECAFVRDYFELDDLRMSLEEGASHKKDFAISPYVIVDAALFKEIDNADLDEIVPSITKQPYSAPYGGKIINLVLELLQLYDSVENIKLLEISIQLLNFVQKYNSIPAEIIELNRIQIEKRHRELTQKEKCYLLSLKAPETVSQYQLAASILLESFQEADLIYSQMSEQDQKIFDSFPITNLWKKRATGN